jgi:hypothetical protein
MTSTAADRFAAEQAAEDVRDKRLLKWLRRQVNADLRKWRQGARDGNPDAAGLIADCKAKVKLLNFAESWMRVRDSDYDGTDDVRIRGELRAHSVMVIVAVRILAVGYRDRDGWRLEWERK